MVKEYTMAELDPLSKAIGSLENHAESMRNQSAELFRKVDAQNTRTNERFEEMHKLVSDMTTVVQTGITSGNARLTEVEKDVKSHGKAIGTLNKFKQRCYIGLAGSGSGGALGYFSGLFDAISKKLGGP